MSTLQLSVFDVSEKMPFGSNDIEEESAANSILITQPKNKEVLSTLNIIWQHLQCEGTELDAFFCLKKITREHAKQH